MADYPSTIQVSLDGVDITTNLFGKSVLVPSTGNDIFRDLDISSLVKGAGTHRIEIYTASGIGQVEARVEIR